MSELLSVQERHELTGYARAGQQAQWMREHGIPHRVDGKRVLVSRVHVAQVMTKKEIAKLTEPVWTPYVITPDIEFFHVDKNNDRESEEGVYFLCSQDGLVLYVGKSTGTRYRITQHHWAMERGAQVKFALCAVLPVPLDILRDVEVAHIHALRPPGNNLFERSRCAWHGDMVQAIRKAWDLPEDEE